MFLPRQFFVLFVILGFLLLSSALIFSTSASAEDEGQTIDDIAGFCQVKRIKRLHRPKYCRPHYCKPRHCRKRIRKKSILKCKQPPIICQESGETAVLVVQTYPSYRCFRNLLKPGLFATDPLPPCFKVYSNGQGAAFPHPVPDTVEKHIPTVNIFNHTPGCYVACYSHNPDKAVYSVTPTIYLVGQLRVRGSYVGRQCVPENYESADIRSEKVFKDLCSRAFSCPGNSCWAGGDTGGWFGL